MNQSDLRPARDFALQFGVKAIVYGGPGSGKTPVSLDTSPRPVALMSEPGFLSVRKSTVPTYPAFNSTKVDEFMRWFLGSHEAKNFDTLVWDSVSQAHEKRVEEELGTSTKGGNEQHGMRAYGVANRWAYKHLTDLYFLPNKHIILIAKLQRFEVNDAIYNRPYFAGKELPVRVPHLFDEILMLGKYNIPGVQTQPGESGTQAFRTKESFDTMARDRSGMLQEFEPPNLSKIIAKCVA